MKENPNLLDEDFVSRFIGKSLVTLRRYRREGTGPAFVRIGRTVFYHRADVGAWMNANRVGPGGREWWPPMSPETAETA
jgi:hypothetical protein